LLRVLLLRIGAVPADTEQHALLRAGRPLNPDTPPAKRKLTPRERLPRYNQRIARIVIAVHRRLRLGAMGGAMRTFLIKAIVAHGKIDANGPRTDIESRRLA